MVMVTKQVNTKLCVQMKFLEHHCWPNKQCSRLECSKISGVPKSVNDKVLEWKVLNLFEKIEIEVHLDNIKTLLLGKI